MLRAIVALTLLSAVAMAGCLGGEARTEWAYNVTQIDDLVKEGRNGGGVVVAVLDTGVNLDHPSLDHLGDGKTENGEVIAFRDFLENEDEPYDPDGHGSHVIGIMAARGSSTGDKLVYGGVDLKGGSPAIQLVVARVCEPCDAAVLADAIRWAVNTHHADIISISLGSDPGQLSFLNPSPEQRDTENAINAAIDTGVVVIASAGNEGPDNLDVLFPANIPGVIAVGAIGKDGDVADMSNRGDDAGNPCNGGSPIPFPVGDVGRCDPNKKPELVAPGVNILSAWSGDAYVRATGTSQAAPFVASVVALILQGKPDLTDRADVMRLKQVLADTAKPVEGQDQPHDEAAGYGLIQAKRAFDAY